MDFYKEEASSDNDPDKEKTITVEARILNEMISIWARDKKEITDIINKEISAFERV
jgi:hypothetical protein